MTTFETRKISDLSIKMGIFRDFEVLAIEFKLNT